MPVGFSAPSEHDACGIALIVDRRGRASREIVTRGLEALRRLAHRGAVDLQGRSSDGAGILTAIPWDLFKPDLPAALRDPAASRIAAMFALNPRQRARAMAEARLVLRREGWEHVTWRDVPLATAALVPRMRASAPVMVQCFARAGRKSVSPSPYRTRVAIEARWAGAGLTDCSISSLSDRTIVYKGLIDPRALAQVFPDLVDPRFHSPFAVLHQRFSTNTWPRWDLAQPFQAIAHNGEINTLRANRLWMEARVGETNLPREADIVGHGGSDSQSLDAAVQWLASVGYAVPHALARLLPPAWENDERLAAPVKAFFRHQSCYAEPWDGPAAIAFADGHHAGAMVDRNGFRPIRTVETADGLVCAASEAGAFDCPASGVRHRGRLGPGEMLVVDLAHGTVRHGHQVVTDLAGRENYEALEAASVRHLRAEAIRRVAVPVPYVQRRHQLFGWTREEIDVIVRPMAVEGHEAVGSMGDDATLAALSTRARPLTDYFRQRFAQVTNPPLDPLREGHVMSLRTLLGRRGRWEPGGLPPVLVEIDSPILHDGHLAALMAQDHARAVVLPMTFDADGGTNALPHALTHLQATACALAANGARVLVLSDRQVAPGHAPMPAVLATAAVDTGLRAAHLRLRASIVVESGEPRDAHHVAALCAFGAGAVLPYLLYDTAASLSDDGETAVERCRTALQAGLLKIMSRMGVCAFEAYTSGRLFDSIGLDATLAAWFGHTTNIVSGSLTIDHLAKGAVARARSAAAPAAALPHPGFHTFRRGGDHHAFNPTLVRQLHQATTGDRAQAYAAFATLATTRPPNAVRDLVAFVSRDAVPLDEVEPGESICRRFFASAMSVGALSPDAHRTIAQAMNSIGARSNSGEGGEEPERLRPNVDASARSATKQVASARFGVTPAYLISATELQIKMAQGSKPGEGGQLPAAKVDDTIARLRHTEAGTSLISPPPHHDIYSIEDLAQLIHDLRTFHPRARMNVKLVSQPGIGVIAAGVVKAGAQAIQISGHAGGTGASPRGSIKHAGAPWEFGLVEAHRALVANGSRHRVVLQTDGGLQTGRDIAIAAALGADEFGFGTSALVAIGCVMARQCHQNTCPVGIATQRPDLKARYAGTPEMLVGYLRLVAQEVRQILASLGLRSVAELVGRSDLLAAKEETLGIDITPLLAPTPWTRRPARPTNTRRRRSGELNRSLALAARRDLGRRPIRFTAHIRNTDRSVGAELAGLLAMRRGDAGTAHAPVEVHLAGSAGQSLWAFALPGMHVRLEGDANDGVGKGMHGGEIVIRPPRAERASAPVLVGNAALYGATGGRLFVAGRAGERFAVRNSGAWAVVEGVGDHGCEYMTAGAVMVLGPVGRNFAAGMTGGIAYVLDASDHTIDAAVAARVVRRRDGLDGDESWVRAWLAEHHERTGSALAAELLRHWRATRDRFSAITPVRDHDAAPVPRENSEPAVVRVPVAFVRTDPPIHPDAPPQASAL
jgi:glutamate synthase domain-containing protein 2/glutamate synthase domain-containing protein 1/glutamate synthase domain-containing protein 3